MEKINIRDYVISNIVKPVRWEIFEYGHKDKNMDYTHIRQFSIDIPPLTTANVLYNRVKDIFRT